MAPRTRGQNGQSGDKGNAGLGHSSAPSELEGVIGEILGRSESSVTLAATNQTNYNVVPTGIFTLDYALLGGIPEGRFVQPFGYASAGKTTLCLKFIAGLHRKDPECQVVFIDVENSFDTVWASKMGVDLERTHIVRPTSGEEAVDVIQAVLKAREVRAVILDSIPALVPIKERDSSAEDSHMALQARLVGRMCNKIKLAALDESKRGHFPTFVGINQWRSKMVQMGDPRQLAGGQALTFAVDVSIEVKNKEMLSKETKEADFNEHSFVIKKMKGGNSLKEGEFRMVRNPDSDLGEGFVDDASTVLTYGRRGGLVTGSGGGGWSIEGVDQKFKKLEEMVDFLNKNRDVYTNLKVAIIKAQRVRVGYPELPPDGYLG